MSEFESPQKQPAIVIDTGRIGIGASVVGVLGIVGSVFYLLALEPIASGLFLIAAALAFGLRGLTIRSE